MRFLMTTDTVGGVWTFTKELAGELLQRGHSVTLVAIGPPPALLDQQAFIAFAEKVHGRFHFASSPAPLEWMPGNASAYEAAEALLLKLCREFRPDALLLSQFCFGALPVSIPKIVIAHSDVLSWAEAAGKAPLVEDVWLATYRQLVQRGLNGADAVVAPTWTMLRDLQRGFQFSCTAAVVPNGRSLVFLGEVPERKLQAITAGRLWDEAKNLNLLEKINTPMLISVAGEGAVTPQQDLRLRFLGRLSEQDLLAQFLASAIYICTSVYEPFGLAPLEAALCGCAILANDIPSLREVWAEGALYFHDAVSLSALLHLLRNDPEQLEAAQVHSSERASHYTVERMADAYVTLVTDSMEQNGRAIHAA